MFTGRVVALWVLLGGTTFGLEPVSRIPETHLPNDVVRVLEEHEEQIDRIRKRAELELLEQKQATLQRLRDLQERYTKSGQLDAALAIRRQIELQRDAAQTLPGTVQPAPDRLLEYRESIGQTLVFQVTGRLGGSVWGTGIYTGDSSLATAAVHAGLVEPGQTAIIRVTILPGQTTYSGTEKHGVSTFSYGSYPFSYRLQAHRPPAATASSNWHTTASAGSNP